MEAEESFWAKWFLLFLLTSGLIVLGQSMYKNYIQKDYLFYVEGSCDPAVGECYIRSCETEGDCPPNNLETYRAFELPASEFRYCSDNSCLNICPSSAHSCTELLCSEQSDVECQGPLPAPDSEAASTNTATTSETHDE